MNIGIVTFYTPNYAHFGQLVDANKEVYAGHHGYTFHTACYEYLHVIGRAPAWQKILELQKFLAQHDWLFWTDVDSVIVNRNIKLEQFIDNSYDIVIAKDFQPSINSSINTGQFFVRNTPWAHKFLQRVWDEVKDLDHLWWEQASMIELLKLPDVKRHIKVVEDYTLFNDNICTPDRFIVHYAGVRDRENLVPLLQRAIAMSHFRHET